MKASFTLVCLLASLSLAGIPTALQAGDETNHASSAPARESLREQLKHLSPEERQTKIKEWRAQHSLTNWPAIPRREELGRLSPEQRAKVLSLRQEHAAAQHRLLNGPSTEARHAKLKTKQAELHKKQADGTLTPEEEKLLKHLDQAVIRFDPPKEEPKPESNPPARKP